MLNGPFEMLKDALKDTVSVEGLGGNGAAEAIGERHICVSIPPSAWRGGVDELYSAQYSIRRVINIIPDESDVRDLSDFPMEYDPDSAVVDDVDVIERMMAALDDPNKKEQATEILRLANRTSVSRQSDSYDNYYRDHKLRYGRLPSFDVTIVPKGEFEEGGRRFGDFMLRTDETAISVSTGSMVLASRTNENAGARAVLTSSGFEMRLLQANIPNPFQVQAKLKSSPADAKHSSCLDCGRTQRE